MIIFKKIYTWINRICLVGVLIVVTIDLFFKQYSTKFLTFLLASFLIIGVGTEILIYRNKRNKNQINTDIK